MSTNPLVAFELMLSHLELLLLVTALKALPLIDILEVGDCVWVANGFTELISMGEKVPLGLTPP